MLEKTKGGGLQIIGGDWNMTGEQQDRQRSEGIKTEVVGEGGLLGFLKGANFKDTHEKGLMTHEQNTKEGGVTKSRIDRIYIKSENQCNIMQTEVRNTAIKTNHKWVVTTLEIQNMGIRKGTGGIVRNTNPRTTNQSK
jgi:hypothetical protein